MPQLTVGGTERHLHQLSRGLAAHGIDVVVWCSGPWGPVGDAMLADGLRVERWLYPGRVVDVRAFAAALRALRGTHADIFHSYGYGAQAIDAILARCAGIPVYVSSRRNVRHWARNSKASAFERLRNGMTDAIVANSQAAKDAAVRTEGVPPERILVVPNGIGPVDVLPRAAARAALGAQGPFVIGTVANLKRVKGLDVLVEAVGLLHADKALPEGWRLIVIGEGPERENLVAQAARVGVDAHVRLAGQHVGAAALLSAFDLFVLPSRAEGFSNALVEAMSAGLPIVATSVGGNPEAVGDAAVLVPPEDSRALAAALRSVIADSGRRAALGRAAMTRAANFSLAAMVHGHVALYRELLSAASARASPG